VARRSRTADSVAERSSKILGDFVQRQAEGVSSAVRDEMGIAKAFMDLYARMAVDPALMATVSMNIWSDYMRLWQASWMKLFGLNPPPVAEPEKGDSRFKDEGWSRNFLFDLIKQSYLISARHIREAVAKVEGLPPESEKKVAFFTRQYVDALAPSNFLLTNPQVLRETVASGGQNLVRGLKNLLADIEKETVLTGTGRALVASGGHAVEATWSKSGTRDRVTLTGADEDAIAEAALGDRSIVSAPNPSAAGTRLRRSDPAFARRSP
jgi:polyhydroxyalkanoate synthase subunit PhaC